LKDTNHFTYFLILPFHIKIYCLNFTSNRSKKLISSALTAASITLHFKIFYLVMMKLNTKKKIRTKKILPPRGSNSSHPRGSSVVYHWSPDAMLVWKLVGFLLRVKRFFYISNGAYKSNEFNNEFVGKCIWQKKIVCKEIRC
jgi:hypothetical protein